MLFLWAEEVHGKQEALAAHLPHPVHYTQEPRPRRQVKEQPERAAAATRTSQTPTTPARKEPQRQEPRREAHPTRRRTRRPPLKPKPGRARQPPPTTHTRSNKPKQTAAAAAADKKAGRAHGRALPHLHNTQHTHMPRAHENTRRAESSLAPQRSRALGKPN